MGKQKQVGVGMQVKEERSPGGRGERAPRQIVVAQKTPPHKQGRPQSYEIKRKAVRLYLEEGIPSELVAREVGVSKASIFDWTRQYREGGTAGLEPKRHSPRPVNGGQSVRPVGVRALIRAEITKLKQAHPAFGVRRIVQTLRRILHLPASAETVRRTLHQAKLITPAKKKPPRNPSKPRFFERSTPNQLWQSDIFPFKLNAEAARPAEWLGPGGYTYLIGFIDDHSRYITALEIFRSQTADNLLEVYRRGVGAYGTPQEMLTDNGRQYTNWRGKTAFERELAKGRVHHLRSRPHHPQTLGKIERFWKTIYEEFLVRARFATFEEARERLRYWVEYYNHKRPHQGIEGLCPADRFFKIQDAVRAEIEKAIAQNVQDLALHGKRQPPFYMVGRMGAQAVTIRQEDGQVKLVVERAEGGTHESGEQRDENAPAAAQLQCAGEGGGGAGVVERAAEPVADRAGTGDQLGHLERLGAERPAGDAQGAGGRTVAGPSAGGTGPTAGADVERPAADGNPAAGGGGGHPLVESGVKELTSHQEKDYAERGTETLRREDAMQGETQIQRDGTVPGGAGGVVGAAERNGGVPPAADQQRALQPVAGAGHGGTAGGAGTAGGPGTRGEPAVAAADAQAPAGEAGGGPGESRPAPQSGGAGETAPRPGRGTAPGGNEGGLNADDGDRGRTLGADGADHARRDPAGEDHRRGAPTGRIAPDVLPVGGAGPGGDGRGARTPAGGPAGTVAEPARRDSSGGERPAPAGEPPTAADPAHPGVAA